MKLFSEETLSHYGIPGMKHGVRRWQYEDGRFNEEGKIRYFGYPKRKKSNDAASRIDKDIAGIVDPDIAITLVLWSSMWAGISIYKAYLNSLTPTLEKLKSNITFKKKVTSKEPNNEITKNINDRRKKEEYDEELNLYLKNKKTSVEEDMKNVNPYYSNDPDIGNKMNCVYCAGTYILRRAGFDAIAHYNTRGTRLFNLNNGGDKNDYSKELFKGNVTNSWTNPFTNNKDINKLNKKEERDKTYNQFVNELKKLKNNEASIIGIKYFYGGHYLNAEKINNKIFIIDSQNNKKYTVNEFKDQLDKFGGYVSNCSNINYGNINKENLNKNIIQHISHMGIY